MSLARGIAALGAVVGLIGLGLQFRLIFADAESFAAAVWSFFAYFTILTNTLVTLVLARAALKGGDDGLNAPRIELMTVTSILFVCVVYNLLLANRWDPQGWQKVADLIVHQIVPALCAFYWLARPHGRLKWSDAAFAAIWPAAYSAYGLARGALDGFYPYFFTDPTQTSWGQIAINMAGLVVAFVIGGLVLVAVDGALARRAPKPA